VGTDDPQGFAMMVRLVPIAAAAGLKGFGSLKSVRGDVDKVLHPNRDGIAGSDGRPEH
jgi:hypothetical protein